MKKLFKHALAIILILGLASCEKRSKDDILLTPAGLEQALLEIYDIMPTLENVSHERQVEFAFEGHESYTLWRHRAYLGTSPDRQYRKHTLVPMLDLRGILPGYIFPRANAYWSDVQNAPDGVGINVLDYYGPIPNIAKNHLTGNPCQE